MPTRILRDGIIDSRAVNALSEPAEILYRRLMSVVDDHGRFDADPHLIQARCFPRQAERWPVSRVMEFLVELRCSPRIEDEEEAIDLPPLVTVYRCGIKKYLQINNFGQRVQSKPKFPGPDDDGSQIIHPKVTVTHGEQPPRASRAHSESESDAKTESKSSLPASPKNGSSTTHGSRFSEEFLPAEWEAWSVNELHWTVEKSRYVFLKFADYWREKAGASGRKVDWIGTWRNWCRRDEEESGKRNGLSPPTLFPIRESPTEKAIRVGYEQVAKTGKL